MSITIVSEDVGELLAKGAVFSAIDYDPVGKDDNAVKASVDAGLLDEADGGG